MVTPKNIIKQRKINMDLNHCDTALSREQIDPRIHQPTSLVCNVMCVFYHYIRHVKIHQSESNI